MNSDDLFLLCSSIFQTLAVYLPAWVVGTLLGIVLSYFLWYLPMQVSGNTYAILSGVSFIPTTILIPFFIRSFGLDFFIYPLLVLPVTLITLASSYEAFQSANKHRITLLVNYGIGKTEFFWKVVFREALPSMKTTARQTLSLCFAIFLAIDYFLECWKGLGAMAHKFYSEEAMNPSSHVLLLLTIGIAWALGYGQVVLNDFLFKKPTEFRRHY